LWVTIPHAAIKALPPRVNPRKDDRNVCSPVFLVSLAAATDLSARERKRAVPFFVTGWKSREWLSPMNPAIEPKGRPMTKTLTEHDLNQFTGSETWFRHPLVRSILFTDGAKHVADHGGAYWLLDEIAFAQRSEKAVAAEEFQAWKLTVDLQQHTATLTCEDGNFKTVFTKPIAYTDFPLPEITLWFANNTIYLPSEH
jgi:hypothetical protein